MLEHMVKIDNVISMDFAKTPILVLLSKSSMYSTRKFNFSNSFCPKSNFHEIDQNSRSFIKVFTRKVITRINFVLAKFCHWPYSSLKSVYFKDSSKNSLRLPYQKSIIKSWLKKKMRVKTEMSIC